MRARGLHSLFCPHGEVTEPSELAECGNQNRRASLMPGGREEEEKVGGREGD